MKLKVCQGITKVSVNLRTNFKNSVSEEDWKRK